MHAGGRFKDDSVMDVRLLMLTHYKESQFQKVPFSNLLPPKRLCQSISVNFPKISKGGGIGGGVENTNHRELHDGHEDLITKA
jgi:hypothetical protein